MGMVRAMRMINAVEVGTTSGAELETLLADDGRLSEFKVLMDMPGQTKRIVAGDASLTAITESITASLAFAESPTAIEALGNNDRASETALNASVWYNNETIVDGVLADLNLQQKILTMNDITAAFNAVASTLISVAALSDTKAIVCYRGMSNYGTACALTITGDVVTYGTPVAFNAVDSPYISVAALSDTKAIVCYSGTSSYGSACVLTITGDVVTYGTPVAFNAVSSTYISVAALSDTKAIVCYSGTSSYGNACVLTITGSVVTYGTPVAFNAVASIYISVAALSDTKAIVCSSTSSYGNACVLTITGSVVTYGTPVAFNAVASIYISVAALSDTKAIVCYGNASNYGSACVLTITGSVVTYGTPVAFNNVSSHYISVAALSDTKAIVCYGNVNAPSYGSACALTITGDVATYGTPVAFNAVSSTYISVAVLAGWKCVVCYRGTSGYGWYNLVGAS